MIKLLLLFALTLPILPQTDTLHVLYLYTTQPSDAYIAYVEESVYDALYYWKSRDHVVPHVVFSTRMETYSLADHVMQYENTLFIVQGYYGGNAYANGVAVVGDFWDGHPIAMVIAHELGHTLYNYRDRYNDYSREDQYHDLTCRVDIMCNTLRAYYDSLTVYLPMVQ